MPYRAVILSNGLCLTVLLTTVGCSPGRANSERRDVQAYRTALAEWRRDSAVIDSLSRLVNTDSLLQIRRAELQAGRASRVTVLAMMCENLRLEWQHGFRPHEVAVARLDSAMTADERRRYWYIERSAPGGFYKADSATCGVSGPRAPKSVHGISLTQTKLRPWHPDSLPSPFR